MDEARLPRQLEDDGSKACAIYRHFDLNRAALKATFVALGRDRNAQGIFANIICGAFFKYYSKQGELVSIKCPLYSG